MLYSVQQIKYEFLCYIKEFGGRSEHWQVGNAVDAREALFSLNGVHPEHDIWLWKPALSPAAANMVVKWFTERFHVKFAGGGDRNNGSQVFLFRVGEV